MERAEPSAEVDTVSDPRRRCASIAARMMLLAAVRWSSSTFERSTWTRGRSIEHSSQSLHNKFASLDKFRHQEIFEVPNDDLRATAIRSTLLLTTADRSTLIGGIEYGLTFIEEAHRGQGYSKYLHLAVDGLWNYFLGPSHYSAGGLAARASAHRTATELAVEAGLQGIHPENLARYGFEQPIEAVASAKDDLANGSFRP